VSGLIQLEKVGKEVQINAARGFYYIYKNTMAWRSSGTDNDDLVDNLASKFPCLHSFVILQFCYLFFFTGCRLCWSSTVDILSNFLK
jgi:hypothetical protein